MTTHPFRWAPFAFGLLFAAVTASWAVLRYDLLTVNQLGVAGPLTLIVLGLLGVALTFRSTT